MTFKSYEIKTAVLAIALCITLLGVTSAESVATEPSSFEPTNNVAHTKPKGNRTRLGKHIPKLPYFAGVTLSGMDFAAYPTNETNKVHAHDSHDDDHFTLPSFDQAMHYLKDRHLNLVKLPLAWESLEQFPFNHTLNHTRLETYTDVVASVTNENASVVLTLSTSAERFDTFCHGHDKSSRDHSSHKETSRKGLKKPGTKNDIGNMNLTDDATNAAFVELWGKLAFRFKNHRRVIFHLMEIPHGSSIPSKKWNETIQAAVTKIRSTGANNVILLPSFAPPQNTTTFNTFRNFPTDFETFKNVTNPDGSTDGIVFDLSLTLGPKRNASERCGGVNATAIVQPVVKLLREHKRQAIVGTLAAGSEDSCTKSLFKLAKEISSSYPHLAGFVLYGAGAYPEDKPWSLIKEGKFSETYCSEEWVDQPNFASVMPLFPKSMSAPKRSISQ